MGHPEIRWLCLSDLHLGAKTSLLTDVDDDGEPRVHASAGPLSAALATALRELLGDQERPPRLVLLGDALELALEQPGTTMMALERFLELLTSGPRLIDDEVWYVPGNHDHHMWEVARQEMYAAEVAAGTAGDPLPDAWHVSFMTVTDGDPQVPRRGRPATPALLRAVGRRAGGLDVRVVYPNLALAGDDGKLVVLHHGHFTEQIYTAMTAVREAVFPVSRAEREAQRTQFWRLEEDNGAWIEFLWSGLGRSGAAGSAVDTGFEMLGDDHAAVALVDRAAEAAIDSLRSQQPGEWRRRAVGAAEPLARAVARRALDHVRARERLRGGGPISAELLAGLHRYVGDAVRAQHLDESRRLGRRPADQATFVFGHTHKPFAATLPIPGWGAPVSVLNTGGWVVDGTDPHPMNGAAVVLVDERLDAAAVHVSTQSPNPANQRVRVLAPASSPLAAWLAERIDHADGPWRRLARVGAAEVVRRREQTARRLDRSVASLR